MDQPMTPGIIARLFFVAITLLSIAFVIATKNLHVELLTDSLLAVALTTAIIATKGA